MDDIYVSNKHFASLKYKTTSKLKNLLINAGIKVPLQFTVTNYFLSSFTGVFIQLLKTDNLIGSLVFHVARECLIADIAFPLTLHDLLLGLQYCAEEKEKKNDNYFFSAW